MFIEELADRAHHLALIEVPEEVTSRTVTHLVDTVGALLLGNWSLGERIGSLADSLGLQGIQGSVAEQRRVAFVGGVCAHAWEVDDLHCSGVLCPGCVILPTLLAGVERSPALSWHSFVRAYLIGYEVALSAAVRTGSAAFIAAGWWPTSIFAPMGGAAALSVLTGQDRAKTVSAVAIAAQHAGGAIAGSTETSDSRYLLSGSAADRAVCAVAAAESGWTGPADLFDLERTPFRPASAQSAAEPYLLPATSMKPYPAAKHLQAAIDIVLELSRSSAFRADAVTSIECMLPRQIATVVDRPAPFPSTLGALVSAQFVLASVMLRGRLTVSEYGPTERADADIVALSRRIRVLPDDGLAEAYPDRWGARVEIVMTGETLSGERFSARGDRGDEFTVDEAETKFVECASPALGTERSLELVRTLLGPHEHATAADVIGHDVLSAARGRPMGNNAPPRSSRSLRSDALSRPEEA